MSESLKHRPGKPPEQAASTARSIFLCRGALASRLVVLLSVVACGGSEEGNASDVPGPRCGPKHGSTMTEVTLPSGRTFCIDDREVTQAEYAGFLGAKAAWHPAKEPAVCAAWSRQPFMSTQDDVPSDCPLGAYDPEKKADRPMVCASWCDANAYCAWAGKRLCGRTDGQPLVPSPWDDPKSEQARSPQVSEWAFACSSGGKYPSTTGATTAQGCPGPDVDLKAPTDCHSPDQAFATIAYMNGGAGEWIGDLYEDPNNGGFTAFLVPLEWASCSALYITGPGATPTTGIRCCRD